VDSSNKSLLKMYLLTLDWGGQASSTGGPGPSLALHKQVGRAYSKLPFTNFPRLYSLNWGPQGGQSEKWGAVPPGEAATALVL